MKLHEVLKSLMSGKTIKIEREGCIVWGGETSYYKTDFSKEENCTVLLAKKNLKDEWEVTTEIIFRGLEIPFTYLIKNSPFENCFAID